MLKDAHRLGGGGLQNLPENDVKVLLQCGVVILVKPNLASHHLPARFGQDGSGAANDTDRRDQTIATTLTELAQNHAVGDLYRGDFDGRHVKIFEMPQR